ncbi:LacI family DNA-binding transcriptional regulator [Microbacterium sp. NIBRBAC000506063]|uniref:LacI family DNA-binding transcriptional regulator n=1 Tax=Microbacterium sp. NIBRBAC000506063 TaxID=2734618 RepID=UPI001BB4933D|nr:LacI family DNA-binding transcriptional regulator [Microbacterium sp. NIBRBAC000506063]QTV79249.1 LacI family DNA-binding transcriptional regulator [Microbacterium sp. NIBRBAC000506063]
MAGIADVAALAGVSKSTASRALSGRGHVSATTRAKVVVAAETLGYVPSTTAVSLATGHTNSIGVIMPYVTRWFFAEVLEGVQQRLLEEGLDLTLYDAKPGTAARARVFDDFLARKRFDGLIAIGLEPEDRELERLLAIGCPLVSVVGIAGSVSVIAVDDDYATRRATEHLIGLGHESIAFLGGGGGEHWPQVERRRLEGYTAAMEDAGLAAHISHIRAAASLPASYNAAVDALGDVRSRPTGIVAVSDEVAVGGIIAARRLGIRVPGDLSVVGIDDHEYAEMFSLTTLRQVPREQGAAAVDLLLAHLADPEKPPQTIHMKARLIVRSSTAAPPE